MTMTDTELIALIDRLAADQGATEEARRKWKERGAVPHRWRLPLITAAAEEGRQIPPAIFDRFTVTAETNAS